MIGTPSEHALVALCKAGDQAAFAELIQRNSLVAVRAIRAIVPNPTDAEDILQETLLKAYKGVACFKEQSKFSTWLTRIAINCALQSLRSRRNKVEVSLDWDTDAGESRTLEPADSRVDPEQTLIRSQSVSLVREAVRTLPVHLRQYMRMRYFDGLPHGQVAASMGISLAAGKSRSMRACQRLESSLGHVFGRPA
jgi:RNA polymerase sigma-70 factor (ECF subfamily)